MYPKSNAMKSNAKSSLYFSAYPLKAIKTPSAAAAIGSPYLRSVLAGNGKTKSSKMRIFPMANPYPLSQSTETQAPVSRVTINKITAGTVDATGEEWFSNYE